MHSGWIMFPVPDGKLDSRPPHTNAQPPRTERSRIPEKRADHLLSQSDIAMRH